MGWKMARRPEHKITQTYNDGAAVIYSVFDSAAPGYQPVEARVEKIRLHYEERRVGIERHYTGRQNQLRIERVIRVPHAGGVTSQDVLVDERGREYRIDLVQHVPDVYPPSDDLTLVEYTQNRGV